MTGRRGVCFAALACLGAAAMVAATLAVSSAALSSDYRGDTLPTELVTLDHDATPEGVMVLTDDDAASALFNAESMLPGHRLTSCITIVYRGPARGADVRFHAASQGQLADSLDIVIEVGVGGSFSSCVGFLPTASLFEGTLSELSATHRNWSTGVSLFHADTTPITRTTRITATLRDDPAAQGHTAAASFIWDVRNPT